MFQRHQMLAPLRVDRLQEKLLFDRAHRVDAEGLGLLRDHLVALGHDALQHHGLVHALFRRPGDDRQVHVHLLDDRSIEPLGVPLVGVGLRRQVSVHQVLGHLVAHVLGDLLDVGRLHDLQPLAEDRLALVVHHVVELQQLLADVEVAALDLGLRPLQRLVDPRMLDRFAFLHAKARQDLVQPFRAEDPHQVVFQRQEEDRPARVALTARAAAELVVDPARFVALGAQHEEAAGAEDAGLLLGMFGFDPGADLVGMQVRIGGDGLQHLHLDIAAQLDVGAAAGHVGGDGHRAELAGIGDDLGLGLVLASVQHVVLDARGLQQAGEIFRLLDRGRADEDRLALLMRLGNGLDHAVVFLPRGAVDLVVVVAALDAAVGRDLDHAELVDLHELFGLGRGRAGHAAKLGIEAEVVLKGHRGQRHVLGLDLDAFLGLDGLVQAFGQAAAAHHPAGEFVDQHDLAILDDVMLVLLVELVGAQTLRHVMDDRGRFRVIERLALGQQPRGLQAALDEFVALFGEGHLAGLLVQLEVFGLHFGDQHVDLLIKVAAVLARARDDQRRAGLVDQDAVHLVDDGEEVAALGHLGDRALHVVAQIVEAQLVVGRIGDVGPIGRHLLGLGLEGDDDAGGQAQLAIDLAHPARVALGEVVVDRDDMHALAGQGVQIGREGGDECLALAGAHLGDVAAVQEDAAHQLDVEGAQAERTLGGLAAIGEGLGQHGVKALAALLHALLQLAGALDDALVGQRGKLGLQGVDLRHQGTHRLDRTVVRGAKDLPCKRSETQHHVSPASFTAAGWRLTGSCQAWPCPHFRPPLESAGAWDRT